MLKLRPYQQKAINELRAAILAGKRRLILCAPTGAGKTVMFSAMAKSAHDRGKSVLIVSDRIELMKQSGGALNRMGLNPVEIKAGHTPRTMTGQMYTAMVETLARRMKDARYQRLVHSFDVIVFDEAHKQAFNKLFPYISDKTVVIGATATPYRTGKQKALKEFYDDIIETIDIPALIDQGYLAQPISYGVPVDLSEIRMKGGDYDEGEMGRVFSKNKVFDGVIENYLKLTPGRKALSFSASIESSQELTSRMQEAGVNARHLDSNMGRFERVKTIAWFRRTPDAVLNNVGILTTGFDAPEVEVVILYRATTSLPLFLQMVGRGSRIADGKENFTILDFGENIHRHGFWEQPREWSLEKPKKKKKLGASPVKNCPSCNALVAVAVRTCPYCAHEWPVTPQEKKERQFAELRRLDPKKVRKMARTMTIEEKAEMTKAGLIKPFWVLHNLKDRDEAKEYIRLMGYKPGFWYYNKDRFPNLRGAAQQQDV